MTNPGFALSARPFASSTIIVCEREPYWTPELQRQFHGRGVAVKGCRKWSELDALAQGVERVVDIVDVTAFAAECLAALGRRLTEGVARPVIALASPELADLEWAFREGGVAAFFPDLPAPDDLTRCCRRWLDQ
jgi:hypothetical protein